MRRTLLVILLLALLASVACNSRPVISTASPLSPLTSPLLTATSQPTTTPTPRATPSPTLWPTSTATASPTPLSTPVGIAPPPGLIYTTQNGLWKIRSDGQPSKISDLNIGVKVAPDGTRLLVPDTVDSQGLWLIDLKTGERRNLTQSLGRIVCCPIWWPAHPDWVLFQSWAPDDISPDFGYLTAARLDSQEQRVLDSEYRSNGLPAPAPSGQQIAYDRSGEAWLYEWDSGPQQFDPQAYGVKGIQRIASLAWSPDGRQLAWYIGGDFGQGWQVGLAVFDLKAKTGWLLHVYTNVGRGGWFAAPAWSPDGEWLAFTAEDQDRAQAGLWITRVDGQEEHLIKPIEAHVTPLPVWSSDSRWLAVGRTLYEIGTWRAQLLALPSDAEVVAWINSAPQ